MPKEQGAFSLATLSTGRDIALTDELFLHFQGTQKENAVILTKNDVAELVKIRSLALKSSGRIEFSENIISFIYDEFCDSEYIDISNAKETMGELISLFYEFKNRTYDRIPDKELISLMRDYFNGYCRGSVELLSGKIFSLIVDTINSGGDINTLKNLCIDDEISYGDINELFYGDENE